MILKAPYYRPGYHTPTGGSRGGFARYIGTREGVEKLRSGMAEYIGERKGSNGLFSDEGVTINMSALEKEIDSHPGNVWCLIFSLTREDAERLGYNSAEQWMNLLRSHRNDIAKEMRIAPENLRWTAAFHQKETHPHVHMMVWSTNPNEAYLSKNGIHHIKHTIASDIFRQDLYSIYNEQTMVRNQLKHNFRERMNELVQSIYDYPVYHPELEYNFTALSVALQKQKGKKSTVIFRKRQRRSLITSFV